MRKFLSSVVAIIGMTIALTACSNDDNVSCYSEKQNKAFALFHGTWADTQFSNLAGGMLGHLNPEPDLIVFGKHYDKEVNVSRDDYMNGKVHLYSAHGECTYKNYDGASKTYEDTECYYSVCYNAEHLHLYEKATNRLFRKYAMFIRSKTRIVLHDPALSLPYVFEKQ